MSSCLEDTFKKNVQSQLVFFSEDIERAMKEKLDKHDKFEQMFHLLFIKLNLETYKLLPVSITYVLKLKVAVLCNMLF